jgi:hypothetical protein
MSVHVEMHGGTLSTDEPVDFLDADLPTGTYCFHVGAGGELIIVVDESGESQVDCVYSATAWRTVRGDVWRKGQLLQ